MRKLLYLFIFTLMYAFGGCQRRGGHMVDYEEKDRMHYCLLKLKCQNDLDLPLDPIDSIEAVVDYYNNYGTYNERLLADYLMGRMYMVKGNEPMAMEWFNRCLAQKADTPTTIDYVQLSKVHSQLANIYHDQNISEYELKELSAAKECAETSGDSLLAVIYDYLRVNPYFKMGMMDSVINISTNVRNRYLLLGMKDQAAEVLYMTFDAYIQQKEYKKARHCMEIFERESGVFDADGDIETGREIYYYLKGKLFEESGQLDSAELEYRRLLAYDQDIENVEAASKGLLSLYRTIGNQDSIGKYADVYCESNDSVHAKFVAKEVSRLKIMYDYSEYKQKADEMKMKFEATQRFTMVIIAVSVLLLLFIFCGIYLYRRKKLTETNNLLEEYDRTLQMIEELNDNKEELILQHQEELNSLKNMLETKGVFISNENNADSIHEELLVRFKEYGDSNSNKCLPITTEEWHKLIVEMSNNDSDFMLLMRKSNLSENEKKIAILVRLRFKDYQIKKILDAYGSSLPNYKARINKKLFGQTGAKNLRRLVYAWK